MSYLTDLFTPETFEAFGRSDRTISGFRESQWPMAEKVHAGDKFICYMVRMSRWIGVLEVLEGPFIDRTPIFVPQDDPFIVRFKVTPQVWLPLEQTVPIQEPELNGTAACLTRTYGDSASSSLSRAWSRGWVSRS